MKFKDLSKRVDVEKIRNNRIFWFILLISSALMLCFSLLNIPFLTSIHSYTIGLVFGYFSPAFYVCVGILSLFKITKTNFLKYKYLNFSFTKVFLASLFISFIIIFFIYQNKVSVKETSDIKEINIKTGEELINALNGVEVIPFTKMPSSLMWNQYFGEWFGSYSNTSNAWLPVWWTNGLLTVFIYTIISSIATAYGTLIISFILLTITIIMLFFPDDRNPVKRFISNWSHKRFKRKVKTPKNRKTSNYDEEDEVEFKTFRKPNDDKSIVDEMAKVNKEKEIRRHEKKREIARARKAELIAKKKERKASLEKKSRVQEQETPKKEIEVQKEVVKEETLPFDDPF